MRWPPPPWLTVLVLTAAFSVITAIIAFPKDSFIEVVLPVAAGKLAYCLIMDGLILGVGAMFSRIPGVVFFSIANLIFLCIAGFT